MAKTPSRRLVYVSKPSSVLVKPDTAKAFPLRERRFELSRKELTHLRTGPFMVPCEGAFAFSSARLLFFFSAPPSSALIHAEQFFVGFKGRRRFVWVT
jgi:hypothetical protein